MKPFEPTSTRGPPLSLPPSTYTYTDLPALSPRLCDILCNFILDFIINHPGSYPWISREQLLPFLVHPQSTEPPWCDTNLLVTSLRTPYIYTDFPSTLPANSLGWSYVDPLLEKRNLTATFLGYCERQRPCSRLYLEPTNSADFLLSHLQILTASPDIPWRCAVFLHQTDSYDDVQMYCSAHDIRILRVASFVAGDSAYNLLCFDNLLASEVDSFLLQPLRQWLKQFHTSTLHLSEPPQPRPRRSIASYSLHTLSSQSRCFSQPYFHFLQPQDPDHPIPSPTLSLAGYHPPHHLPKSILPHTHTILHKLYKENCAYYRILRQNLLKHTK